MRCGSVDGVVFGSVAEDYERYRLGYPDELVDTVLGYVGRPIGSAVEIGAGTGKASPRRGSEDAGHPWSVDQLFGVDGIRAALPARVEIDATTRLVMARRE